jgi:hypothetical protein
MINKYILVDGVFKEDEAKEILMNIIGEKIRFHDVQILRKQEQPVKDFEHHINRVAELKSSRDQILEWIEENSLNGDKIRLEAILKIEKVKY